MLVLCAFVPSSKQGIIACSSGAFTTSDMAMHASLELRIVASVKI